MTAETPAAAPAAPAAPASPATPAAAAAPAPAPTIDSLIPENVAPAAPATPAAEPKKETASNQAPPEWFYANGVKGTGEAPAWWKADKYKTVEEQAKAYPELEKRFGAFVGAPKDGKYEFKVDPALGLTVELDNDHPVFKSFQDWATKAQLSQEGYNQVLSIFAQYEASQIPDMGEIKKQVGENADARITAVAQWGKANLDTNTFQEFRSAMSGHNAPAVLKIVEKLIGATRQPALQRPDASVPAGTAGGEAEINAMQAKRDAQGRRLYEIDPNYRRQVEQKRIEFYASQQAS